MKIKKKLYTDPGHGWLEVNYGELKDLKIEDKISSYSYMKDNVVYLEEDCDAAIYLNAVKAQGNEIEFIELNNPVNYHEIRDYESFSMIDFKSDLTKEIKRRGFDTSKIEIIAIG